jgi:hypothetical protein
VCCLLSAAKKAASKPAVKKEKKRKDPNAPKKALTAYILFRSDKLESSSPLWAPQWEI